MHRYIAHFSKANAVSQPNRDIRLKNMRDLETRVTISDALHLPLSPHKDNSTELDTILCHHYILNVLKEPCLLSTVLFFSIETLYLLFGRKTWILNCNFFDKLLSGIKRTQGRGCPPSVFMYRIYLRDVSQQYHLAFLLWSAHHH